PFGLEMCKVCKHVYDAKQFKRLPDKSGGHKCKCADQVEDYMPSWIDTMVAVEDETLGAMMEQCYQCEYCGEIFTHAEYIALPNAKVKICRCGESDWVSHFATFPEELPKKCILASTSEKGNCSKCGQPFVRVVEKSFTAHNGNTAKTLGWKPTCSCDAPAEPAVVLDPFAGAGTVGLVAKKLGRKAILFELSEDYCAMAKHRIEAVSTPMNLLAE
ncbi:hypothetical protein LCGC14_1450290, partial [marine sediment metagenome]